MKTIQISEVQARRFMVAHHHLNPARQLDGKLGIMQYIRHVNCIQYDPINVVGQNPHLLLQSRIKDYRSQMLDELLYNDRKLIDGFDKVMSIYPSDDWPHFSQHRKYYNSRAYQADQVMPSGDLRKIVLEKVRESGPLSSIEIDIETSVDWAWGSTKAGRAGLEMLFFDGAILVAHRIGTRRYFNLTERLLAKKIYSAKDPHPDQISRKDWHVHRRVGGLGLAHWGAGEHWGGMLRMKSTERRESFARLEAEKRVIPVSIEGIQREGFFIRQEDLTRLEDSDKTRVSKKSAAILGALDNFMWDRNLLRWIFDFDYVWEVYKPEKLRKYGYYVLPILYGDKFVARFEPAFDRKTGRFEVKNWWWETEAPISSNELHIALRSCFEDFSAYLGANKLELSSTAEQVEQVKNIFNPLL